MLLLQYFLYYTFLALTLKYTSLKRLSIKTKNTFLNYKYAFRHCIVNHTCNVKKISIFCMHRRLPQRNPFNQNR